MMRNTQYNCKLGKGCGLIEETLSLLEIYQDGMTIDALLEYVHQSNTLTLIPQHYYKLNFLST